MRSEAAAVVLAPLANATAVYSLWSLLQRQNRPRSRQGLQPRG